MTTKKTLLIAITIALLLATGPLLAKGQGGGGSGGGQGTGQGQGMGQGQGQGQGTMDRQRIHLDQGSQSRLQDCSNSAREARRLADGLQRKGQSAGDASRQADQLREKIGTMLQQHDQLMKGLGDAQRSAAGKRTAQLDQTRNRLENQMRSLAGELGQDQPNLDRVAKQARNVEKEIKSWQKTYRKMSSDLGAGKG